jgi:triacylglycerol lipase
MVSVRMLLAVLTLCLGVGWTACPVTAEPGPLGGPNPVLVIGGFDADVTKLDTLRAWLDSRGYTAYSMVLPGDPTATAPISESAQAVADKVAEIRRTTGSARVDLVGHSMGGLAQRHFVKFLSGRDLVGTYVDFGTPEQGELLGALCSTYPGCRDLSPGSPFLTALNADPAVPPGLPAYHLFSENAGAEKLPLPGAINASIQSFCPSREVSHGNEPVDAVFQQLVDAALRGTPLTATCP